MPITKSTVFILGAGASSDYRFPLGTQLRNAVCRLLENSQSRRILLELGHTDEEIHTFCDELRYSGYTSVDVFLEHNPGFFEIGKQAIAATLLPCETETTLFPPEATENHWYEFLANRMGAGTSDWSTNRLAVITFNYDRSFEHYFSRVISQRARMSQEKAYEQLQHVPIVHVHGSLGTYPESAPGGLAYGESVRPDTVSRAASRLMIVSEAEDTLPTFDTAFAYLREAHRIYFLGFGFHQANVRRLKFFDQFAVQQPPHPTVAGTANGFSDRDWQTLKDGVLKGHWQGERVGNVYGFLRYYAALD